MAHGSGKEQSILFPSQRRIVPVTGLQSLGSYCHYVPVGVLALMSLVGESCDHRAADAG
jgi:hypothetical protein